MIETDYDNYAVLYSCTNLLGVYTYDLVWLLMRNPWGKKEWTGAWSDHDVHTRKIRRQLFKNPEADDGVFVIPMKALARFFEYVYFFKTL